MKGSLRLLLSSSIKREKTQGLFREREVERGRDAICLIHTREEEKRRVTTTRENLKISRGEWRRKMHIW